MADISTQTAAIEAAVRGEEVRDSIVDALNILNEATDTGLPAPTISDSGKYLRVDSHGTWALTRVLDAEGVSF